MVSKDGGQLKARVGCSKYLFVVSAQDTFCFPIGGKGLHGFISCLTAL